MFRERIDFIDRPLGLSDDKPPRALAWPMIQRFLRSIDRSDWVGRRDYLILHLMAYYGLRPGEVGLLILDAIDWARGTMTRRTPPRSSTNRGVGMVITLSPPARPGSHPDGIPAG